MRDHLRIISIGAVGYMAGYCLALMFVGAV